jgi:hypothetical protein
MEMFNPIVLHTRRDPSSLILEYFQRRASASEIGSMAALHGRDLLERGFTLEQVVRDYGDVCQSVTNLAHKTGVSIEVDEFRTFNRCLDNAIAGAVTEYAYRQAVVLYD